ncbi:Uncharacterized protein Adt_13613 [Abeliophyllum distichum]|uniref:Uncharacterized protein n=1 Tax=Abeliophyllum distichum TaxID=126358 RepID=A0ABD1TXA5_9LAMI
MMLGSKKLGECSSSIRRKLRQFQGWQWASIYRSWIPVGNRAIERLPNLRLSLTSSEGTLGNGPAKTALQLVVKEKGKRLVLFFRRALEVRKANYAVRAHPWDSIELRVSCLVTDKAKAESFKTK